MKNNQKVSGCRELINCRICGNENLVQFIDFGFQPLANSFLKKEQLGDFEATYPLRVVVCSNCYLVQLKDVVDSEIMFRDYVYFSSGMPASKHFRDYAESVVSSFVKSKDDLVVEIGSNDGHFLAVIKESNCKILGVDPAKNIAKQANEAGIPTIPEFFSETIAKEIVEKQGFPKVVIGNNVVAHIDNYHDLVKGIDILLSKEGVFVFEAPYLVDMFENISFDTIYHEHLSYLAIHPLIKLFDQYNLEIFDVQIHPIQGNSIRVFVCKKGQRPISPAVEQCLEKEKVLGFDTLESYAALADKIKNLKNEVNSLLKDLKQQGKTIVGYGAPAKGNTLLNYYGIGTDILEYLTEELPSKIGFYSPGMHIPVVKTAQMREDQPDFVLLLAWNYKDVILKKEQIFRDKGGKFIMPIGVQRIF